MIVKTKICCTSIIETRDFTCLSPAVSIPKRKHHCYFSEDKEMQLKNKKKMPFYQEKRQYHVRSTCFSISSPSHDQREPDYSGIK